MAAFNADCEAVEQALESLMETYQALQRRAQRSAHGANPVVQATTSPVAHL
jgi:hypothetical protein